MKWEYNLDAGLKKKVKVGRTRRGRGQSIRRDQSMSNKEQEGCYSNSEKTTV